jgi:predicted PurR-regulated permease PerM
MNYMSFETKALRGLFGRDLMDLFIRMGLVAFAVYACAVIFAPFMSIMMWALILAVSLYPLMQALRARTGWSPGRSATVLVLVGLLLIGVPTVMLGSSFATHIFDAVGNFDANEVTISAPGEAVRDWPVVGERVYAAWSAAHTDLPAFIEELQPQLGNFGRAAIKTAASTAATLLFFFSALIIAGIMMGYGESGAAAMGRIFRRIAGEEKGASLHRLATLTVRSVATGVVGVAFIQALLLGVGFMLAGIPAAGLLALVVLVIGILQLPALIVSIPAIAFVWGMGDSGTLMQVVLTVYFIVADAGWMCPCRLSFSVPSAVWSARGSSDSSSGPWYSALATSCSWVGSIRYRRRMILRQARPAMRRSLLRLERVRLQLFTAVRFALRSAPWRGAAAWGVHNTGTGVSGALTGVAVGLATGSLRAVAVICVRGACGPQ